MSALPGLPSHSIHFTLSINRMEKGNYSQETSVSYANSDASVFLYRFHHLIGKFKRGHISFEDLRSEVVSMAQRILLENGVPINEKGVLPKSVHPEDQFADPIN